MKRGAALGCAMLLLGAAPAASAPEQARIAVGSKKFTENVLLGELLALLLRDTGAEVVHRRELGGTQVLWKALLRGDIDVYPEYTGTIAQELLGGRSDLDLEGLRAAVGRQGIRMSGPLGFNNTYALGVKRELAERLDLERISQLRDHPELSFGFTSEFMNRSDGWPGLRERYRLPQRDVRGLDHDLAYRGLESGDLDLVDLYSTDADIRYYDLQVLDDDRGYFPRYDAVLLYREDLARRVPEAVAALLRLEGGIDEPGMVAMNARAKLERVPEATVAADFARQHLGVYALVELEDALQAFWRRTREHLALVAISLGAAIALAVPLGVLSARHKRLGQVVLGATGIVQTIPSLALLVFMIPLLGIGSTPAIAALFLYSLLPIVRNTYTGLHDIPDALRESAEALGLPPGARLRLVELPLAARSILAGIKIAAVINVGTATLAALIGAGGYGQPIFTGIRLDDLGLILQGAVPAAGLALLVQGGFELIERIVVPRGLRLVRGG